MKKLRIKYPSISFEIKDIEVTEDRYEDIMNMCQEEQADFIMQEIGDEESDWIPDGKKGLMSALDCDYANIKLIKF